MVESVAGAESPATTAGAAAAGTSLASAGLAAGGVVSPPQATRPEALSTARVAAIELKLSFCDIDWVSFS
jgi:hypothetical protein